MTNTKALQGLVKDEEILECLIMFEKRKLEAAKMLAGYLFPKWRVTNLEALGILQNIDKEWSAK
jgi:hypothetical protein